MAEIRDEIITKLYKIIKNKKISKEVEIGIYNYTIKFCEKKNILKKWCNKHFKELYIRKAISVYGNLKKTSPIGNKRLLTRLKKKEFPPKELAFMKPQHTFPEHWKELVDELEQKYLKAYEKRLELTTDAYKCGRCHKKQCVYYELQIRSGDESSNIFITCVNCGKRWVI